MNSNSADPDVGPIEQQLIDKGFTNLCCENCRAALGIAREQDAARVALELDLAKARDDVALFKDRVTELEARLQKIIGLFGSAESNATILLAIRDIAEEALHPKGAPMT